MLLTYQNVMFMKQTTVSNGRNGIPNKFFLSFSNNAIAKAAACKIIGGEEGQLLPEESSDFIIIEEVVDL